MYVIYFLDIKINNEELHTVYAKIALLKNIQSILFKILIKFCLSLLLDIKMHVLISQREVTPRVTLVAKKPCTLARSLLHLGKRQFLWVTLVA